MPVSARYWSVGDTARSLRAGVGPAGFPRRSGTAGRSVSPCAIGQDGWYKPGGGSTVHLAKPKYGMEVHGVGGVNELRVPHG